MDIAIENQKITEKALGYAYTVHALHASLLAFLRKKASSDKEFGAAMRLFGAEEMLEEQFRFQCYRKGSVGNGIEKISSRNEDCLSDLIEHNSNKTPSFDQLKKILENFSVRTGRIYYLLTISKEGSHHETFETIQNELVLPPLNIEPVFP